MVGKGKPKKLEEEPAPLPSHPPLFAHLMSPGIEPRIPVEMSASKYLKCMEIRRKNG
jgi:hypothetical protein